MLSCSASFKNVSPSRGKAGSPFPACSVIAQLSSLWQSQADRPARKESCRACASERTSHPQGQDELHNKRPGSRDMKRIRTANDHVHEPCQNCLAPDQILEGGAVGKRSAGPRLERSGVRPVGAASFYFRDTPFGKEFPSTFAPSTACSARPLLNSRKLQLRPTLCTLCKKTA